MTDYTYNYNKILSALEQRQSLTAEAKPKGIASKPNGEASAAVEPDYIEKMLDLLLPHFSSKEDADKVLSSGKPDRDALKLTSIGEVFEDVPKPRGVPDTLRLSEFDDTPRLSELKLERREAEGMAEQERKAVGVAKSLEIPEYKVYTSADDMTDLEILARTIEAEAADQSFEGKIAVGSVIANRVSSGSYGASGGIKGVILEKSQFSPWNSYTGGAKGNQGKDMLSLKASEDSYKAAKDILKGNYTDPTNGSTHYVNESLSEGQEWIDTMKARKKGTVTIGKHLFGNADNDKIYDGKSGIAEKYLPKRPKMRPASLMARPEVDEDEKNETTDQPLVAQPPTDDDRGLTKEVSEAALFSKIVGGESDDYNTVYLGSKVNPIKPITEMTVKEVREWQDASVKAGSESSAAGRFQIIRSTMDLLLSKGAIAETDIFDEETQLKAYTALLKKRKYPQLKASIQNSTDPDEKREYAERLQINLSMEFASIPVPKPIKKDYFGEGLPIVDLKKGQSFYYNPKKPKLNKAQHKSDDFMTILMAL